MDRNAPSDVEILDMARDVLLFLTPLDPPVAVAGQSRDNIVLQFSSSEDDNSDEDEFLRLMSGITRKDNGKGSARDIIHHDSTVKSEPLHIMDKYKPDRNMFEHKSNNVTIKRESDLVSVKREIHRPLIERETNNVRIEQEPALVAVKQETHHRLVEHEANSVRIEQTSDLMVVKQETYRPLIEYEMNNVRIEQEPNLVVVKQETRRHLVEHETNSVRIEQAPDLATVKRGTHSIMTTHVPSLQPCRNPLAIGDEDYHREARTFGITRIPDTIVQTVEPGPSTLPTNLETSFEGNEDEESVVIDLHSTPTRKSRRDADKFQLVSPIHNDAFQDWDFELISLPAQGHRSPTVILSSPGAPFTNHGVSSPSMPSCLRSYTNNPFDAKAPSPTDDLYRRYSPDFDEREASPTPWPSKKVLPPPSSPPTTLSHRSRKGSPMARDLLPRSTRKEDEGSTLWNPDEGWRAGTMTTSAFSMEAFEDDRWDHLVDTSLSPPRMAQEELNDSDGELMSDVFSASWKAKGQKQTGLSRTSSTKDLGSLPSAISSRKGKNRATSASTDLLDWNDDLGSTWSSTAGDRGMGESLSLEEEIVGRAKQRQKRARPPSDVDDDGLDKDGAASEIQRKKAEKEKQKQAKEAERQAKEAERQAKEAERQAKEAEKQAKKAAREQEQQKKREQKEQERLLKEEERQAEKKALRELRIANRLTTKSEGAKEMIVCIEESFYNSDFGLTVQAYLAAIECKVNVLAVAGAEVSRSNRSQVIDASITCDPCPIPNIAFWYRIVNHRYDEDQGHFIPVAEQEVELEAFTLIYMTASHFTELMDEGRLRGHLAIIKRDLRMRKNKERLKMAGKLHHQTMQLREDHGQQQRIIFLVVGMESFFRSRRTATNRQFKQAVRAIGSESGRNSAPSRNATEIEHERNERERIEQEMLWLQLDQHCLVIHTDDDEEAANTIASLTEQIGLRPYSNARKTGLNVCVEGIRSGADPKDTWIKSLQEIHMITNIIAKSIAEEYPSLKSLYEGYRQCTTPYQAQLMLEGIPVIGRRSTLGKVISRRVYDVFMSTDPEKPVS
ncbi:hypothetical protein BC939DRAFT_152399 [Gamsiella multidivaricata]|uniref:uncharacterized protein n=1 Tax=Gamsiella multidivaricata TaxID=101098 RepID=UPI0022203ECA|nr:uncharacterized protein BC939DRAFT_152399 [Gamsiella multidivaricata]KAI7824062.1 hypothetical protein BC939DRAFT_152399 [Gamsiella multidivaricata]